MRIRFAHPPLKLSLKQEGKELLTGAALSASPLELRAEIEISHDGNELMLEAAWPEGTPETAVTVQIEPEGFEGLTETRWSAEAQLNEVLTFLW